MNEIIIDKFTGVRLHPGEPELCEGNGKHQEYECCCDNCDYFSLCFKSDN